MESFSCCWFWKSCLADTFICKAGPAAHSIFISPLLAGRWLWLSAGIPVISSARLRLELQLHLLQYQPGRQQWKSPTDYTRSWGHGHCCWIRWESKQINWVSDNQVMQISRGYICTPILSWSHLKENDWTLIVITDPIPLLLILTVLGRCFKSTTVSEKSRKKYCLAEIKYLFDWQFYVQKWTNKLSQFLYYKIRYKVYSAW